MIIRKAEQKDVPQMNVIFRDDLGEPQCTEKMLAENLEKIDGKRECVLVAEKEGLVCGVIHVEMYQVLYFEPMINILGLAVSGTHRHQGIGAKLLEAAENWGREHGAQYMRINSGETRKGAHEFYRAQGCDSEKMQVRFLKKRQGKIR